MKTKLLESSIVFILTIVILYLLLGKQLLHPDQYVYAFGGDAAFIYFNTIFHAWYGQGWTLSNMNYPVHESILMTDAQASISYLLNKLNGFEYIRNHVVGITHSFHYFCIGLASVFSFLTLRKLGVNRWIAIVFGLLLVFLSPQILRLRAGHIGLAYPLVFTAVIYAVVSFEQSRKWKYPMLLFAILIFFGINNIYLLILGAGLASLYAVISFIWSRWNNISGSKPSVLWLLPFTAIPVLLVFILIKSTAPEMDRIEIQWGYFANRIKLKGLLYPYTSLIGTLIGKPKGNIEAVTNLGVVNAIMVIAGLVSFFISPLRKKIIGFFNDYVSLKYLLIASLVMLLYSMGSVKFMAELIPAVTMFKASGRFAWPFFYVMSLITIVALSQMHISLALSQKNKLGMFLIISAMLLWGAEDFNYLKKHVKFKLYRNHYHVDKLKEIEADLSSDGIDVTKYQGIYSLPVMVGWNDKFHTKAPWNTEYSSTRISMATGLPLINGMLSRIGLTRANQLVQLASHPIIAKELLSSLDDRPILIVLGKDHELQMGEQYLIDQSTLLTTNKHHLLYRLDPGMIAKKVQPDCQESKLSFFRQGFDDNNIEDSFYGNGSWKVTNEEKIFTSATSFLTDSVYELSLYVKTDNHKYGMPWLRVEQFNDAGVIKKDIYDIASSKDIDGAWRRAGMQFKRHADAIRLDVHLFNVNQSYVIDELQIRSIQDTVCVRLKEEDNRYLYNNYLVQ